MDDAERRGQLRPGMTLVEATAGNTGIGLALVAAVRGYRLVCVMPEKMSEDKRAALRAAGVEVVTTENAPPHDPRNFQQVARRLAAARGWFLTDQFAHPANPRVHEETTRCQDGDFGRTWGGMVVTVKGVWEADRLPRSLSAGTAGRGVRTAVQGV